VTTWHLLSAGSHFVDKRRSLGRYSSLATQTMEFGLCTPTYPLRKITPYWWWWNKRNIYLERAAPSTIEAKVLLKKDKVVLETIIWVPSGSDTASDRTGWLPACQQQASVLPITRLATYLLVCCSAYSLTLKMEAIHPKHLLTFNGLRGAISQKIVLFTTADVQNVKSCITWVVVTGLRNVKLLYKI
jgi:hypothetical protein